MAKTTQQKHADADTVRMLQANPHLMNQAGPAGLKGLEQHAQDAVRASLES